MTAPLKKQEAETLFCAFVDMLKGLHNANKKTALKKLSEISLLVSAITTRKPFEFEASDFSNKK